jgi:hypothetical protein
VGKGLPFEVVKKVDIVEGNYIQKLNLKDTILDMSPGGLRVQLFLHPAHFTRLQRISVR